MKGVGLLRKLQCFLPRSSLLTIYESLIRPHLHYEDAIHDQPSNATFSSKIESIQYNVALGIYLPIFLIYLHDRRWMRHLCLIMFNKVPKYIYELIPPFRHSFRNSNLFTSFTCRTKYFKSSFFPSFISDWNKLDSKIRNSTSYLTFKNALINFIRPSHNKIFNIHNEVGVKLLTRL